MSWLRVLLIIAFLVVFMNADINVRFAGGYASGQELASPAEYCELEGIIRGALEDESWMTCKSKEEVRSNLSRYFGGCLRDDLTERTWAFIAGPTDWYSRYRMIYMKVLYVDDKRAVVEALARIEEMDTGHNETGEWLFSVYRTGECWRIEYLTQITSDL